MFNQYNLNKINLKMKKEVNFFQLINNNKKYPQKFHHKNLKELSLSLKSNSKSDKSSYSLLTFLPKLVN